MEQKMKPESMNFFPNRNKTIVLLTAAFAAGYLWKTWSARHRAFEIPGSRSTIPDQEGHYDMDGVSFDDKCGVVVGSDGRTPAKVGKAHKRFSKLKDKLPRSAS